LALNVPGPVFHEEQVPVEPFESVAVQLGGRDEKLFAGQLMLTVPAVAAPVTSVVLTVAAGEVIGTPALLELKALHL
jgi:histidinol dehydrogenase